MAKIKLNKNMVICGYSKAIDNTIGYYFGERLVLDTTDKVKINKTRKHFEELTKLSLSFKTYEN